MLYILVTCFVFIIFIMYFLYVFTAVLVGFGYELGVIDSVLCMVYVKFQIIDNMFINY